MGDGKTGKNTQFLWDFIQQRVKRLTKKTFSDSSKFLSQKIKHMRADLIKYWQSSATLHSATVLGRFLDVKLKLMCVLI
jgi:hypothetical protein